MSSAIDSISNKKKGLFLPAFVFLGIWGVFSEPGTFQAAILSGISAAVVHGGLEHLESLWKEQEREVAETIWLNSLSCSQSCIFGLFALIWIILALGSLTIGAAKIQSFPLNEPLSQLTLFLIFAEFFWMIEHMAFIFFNRAETGTAHVEEQIKECLPSYLTERL